LRWHHKAPKYKGDFDVFIWQPHQEEPVPEFAHIFFPMASPEDFSFAMKGMPIESSRMIIMFRSSEELQSQQHSTQQAAVSEPHLIIQRLVCHG